MAIPADDPRLNAVRVKPALEGFRAYERDDEGRILFDADTDPDELLFLEPARRVLDEDELRAAVDTSISELADGAQQRDVTRTAIG